MGICMDLLAVWSLHFLGSVHVDMSTKIWKLVMSSCLCVTWRLFVYLQPKPLSFPPRIAIFHYRLSDPLPQELDASSTEKFQRDSWAHFFRYDGSILRKSHPAKLQCLFVIYYTIYQNLVIITFYFKPLIPWKHLCCTLWEIYNH